MSVYECDHCNQWFDDDVHPMEQHPFAKMFHLLDNEVVCPGCAVQLEYEMEEALKEDVYDD